MASFPAIIFQSWSKSFMNRIRPAFGFVVAVMLLFVGLGSLALGLLSVLELLFGQKN
jgi:hypothetical protein